MLGSKKIYKRYHCNKIYVRSQSDNLIKWQRGHHYNTIGQSQSQFIKQPILEKRYRLSIICYSGTKIANVDRLSRPVESRKRKSVVWVRHCIRAILFPWCVSMLRPHPLTILTTVAIIDVELNHMGSISCHITPLVINSFKAGHTYIHRHLHRNNLKKPNLCKPMASTCLV